MYVLVLLSYIFVSYQTPYCFPSFSLERTPGNLFDYLRMYNVTSALIFKNNTRETSRISETVLEDSCSLGSSLQLCLNNVSKQSSFILFLNFYIRLMTNKKKNDKRSSVLWKSQWNKNKSFTIPLFYFCFQSTAVF